MSLDGADDLEYAEDLIFSLAHELRATRIHLRELSPHLIRPSFALDGVTLYCRPTCRWRNEGHCAEGDTCGCRCEHGEGASARTPAPGVGEGVASGSRNAVRRTETRTRPASDYEECVEVTCDLCGKQAPDPDGYDGNVWARNRYAIDRVTIKHEVGTNSPTGGDSRSRSYDICPKCFERTVEPFLRSCGAVARESEIDW